MRGGPTGDLYIFIEVKDHPDLSATASTCSRAGQPSATAALVGKVRFPTSMARRAIVVPEGAQTRNRCACAPRECPPCAVAVATC